MKNHISSILILIACVLLVINSIKINNLQEELNGLRSNMNNEIYTVNRNIDTIYSDVQDMLEEEANQLAVSEWIYGDIDIDARTAEVICTIVPKVYAPDTTQVSIVCKGQEYTLTYANEQYTATIELPLFDRSEFNMVKLNDNGTVRTQELDWIIEPRYEALLLSHAGMGGSATGKSGDGEYVWSPEYSVIIDIQGKGEFQIQSVELIEVLDGKEIGRIPVDLSKEAQDAYAERLRKNNEPIPEVALRVNEATGTPYEGIANFIYYLDKEVNRRCYHALPM